VNIIYVDLEKKENGDGTSWSNALNKLPTNLSELAGKGKKVWIASKSQNSIMHEIVDIEQERSDAE
jgi:hypothetical protein